MLPSWPPNWLVLAWLGMTFRSGRQTYHLPGCQNLLGEYRVTSHRRNHFFLAQCKPILVAISWFDFQLPELVVRELLYIVGNIELISTVQYSAVLCSEIQCSAVQCSAVQSSAVQCSAVHCCAVHFTAVRSS